MSHKDYSKSQALPDYHEGTVHTRAVIVQDKAYPREYATTTVQPVRTCIEFFNSQINRSKDRSKKQPKHPGKNPSSQEKQASRQNGTGEYIHLLNYKDTRLHGLQNDNKKESLNTLIRNLEECDYYKRPQVTKYKDKTKATIESPW